MDWQPGLKGRTSSNPGGSTKRWVSHARHDSPSPHREMTRPSVGFRPRAGGITLKSESGTRLITLDGSSGEGGGQILRTALTLSLLTGQPFRIVKIRANRDKPGLRPQHLKAVEAAARLGQAEVVGGSVGSRDLTFRPGKLEPGDLKIDIGTAGATALVLQTIHLPLALRASGPVRVSLTGGTYNESAPSFPFLETTWRAHMAAIGLPVALAMPRAGFYPEGGGSLEAWIEPGIPRPLVLENRGELVKIRGLAETIRLPGVGRRMADRALESLAERGFSAEIDASTLPGIGPAAAITLTAEFTKAPPVSFVGLGKRGKPAEVVADDAVSQLSAYLDVAGAAVDLHSADQILLPLVFAEGRSVFTVTEVTQHLRTNVETITAFLDKPIRLESLENGEGGRVIVG